MLIPMDTQAHLRSTNQGKNSEIGEEGSEFGLGEGVVVSMCKDLYEKNHEI